MEYERNLNGMNDVIAPKRTSLKPKLIATTIVLKLNMSLTPNNQVNVAESLIWNTLIPFHHGLPNDIDNSNDNENEEEEEEEEGDLSPMPVKSEKTDYTW
jgi:hypothetical protein